MAPPKLPLSKLSKSALWYRKNPKGRKKKNATTHKNNQKPERKRKMAESTKARRKAIKAGKNVKGKDMSHTKNGIRIKDSQKNRGSKSDGAGDKRARGRKKKRKSIKKRK